MTRIAAVLIVIISALSVQAFAQDTLPRFTVVGRANNRNVISWTNPFKSITQIGIQRSTDSTKNFKTIITVPDPSVQQNGFADTKAPSSPIFYRLFIALDSGKYLFTNSKRPGPDNGSTDESYLFDDNQRVKFSDSLSSSQVRDLKGKPKEKMYVVKRREVYMNIPENGFKKFRDSLLYLTKDTMLYVSADSILIKPYFQKDIFLASKYVFTEKYGNVMIVLPETDKKKYSVSFFEENKKPVFDIKEIKTTPVVVDKTNFVHSGWFWFELFENGELIERHKFFIPKDF
ncbi:MAG: hypothetical protein JNK79_16190 [Chitinophagaceae bacterium]|nr:hypothetical protein [Chitinophagaceae bacterium]